MADAGLQSLLDKQEIQEVLHKYCRAIDRCDEELLRSVYHPDAIDIHGTFRGLASEFIPHAMAGLRRHYSATSHCIGNILIELDGDVAFVETYLTAWHVSTNENGTEDNLILGARYVDRFERRDGAWKIAHRTVVGDWQHALTAVEARSMSFVPGLRSRGDPAYAR